MIALGVGTLETLGITTAGLEMGTTDEELGDVVALPSGTGLSYTGDSVGNTKTAGEGEVPNLELTLFAPLPLTVSIISHIKMTAKIA